MAHGKRRIDLNFIGRRQRRIVNSNIHPAMFGTHARPHQVNGAHNVPQCFRVNIWTCFSSYEWRGAVRLVCTCACSYMPRVEECSIRVWNSQFIMKCSWERRLVCIGWNFKLHFHGLPNFELLFTNWAFWTFLNRRIFFCQTLLYDRS